MPQRTRGVSLEKESTVKVSSTPGRETRKLSPSRRLPGNAMATEKRWCLPLGRTTRRQARVGQHRHERRSCDKARNPLCSLHSCLGTQASGPTENRGPRNFLTFLFQDFARRRNPPANKWHGSPCVLGRPSCMTNEPAPFTAAGKTGWPLLCPLSWRHERGGHGGSSAGIRMTPWWPRRRFLFGGPAEALSWREKKIRAREGIGG